MMAGRNNQLTDEQKQRLLEHGFCMIDNPFGTSDLRACAEVVRSDELKKYCKVSTHYDETETRFWFKDGPNKQLSSYKEFCEDFINNSTLRAKPFEVQSILAIKNEPCQNHQKLRWHIDSFQRQYKIFTYLSDVTENSGAFEVIPKTHKMGFKVRQLIKGKYFSIFKRPDWRVYRQLQDEMIDDLQGTSLEPIKITGKAGTTFIADTSAMHRASPCIEKSRLALTAYIY